MLSLLNDHLSEVLDSFRANPSNLYTDVHKIHSKSSNSEEISLAFPASQSPENSSFYPIGLRKVQFLQLTVSSGLLLVASSSSSSSFESSFLDLSSGQNQG